MICQVYFSSNLILFLWIRDNLFIFEEEFFLWLTAISMRFDDQPIVCCGRSEPRFFCTIRTIWVFLMLKVVFNLVKSFLCDKIILVRKS